ncbi:ImmA/IrrE family metallo-endopeptidase [Vagococcus hydrophili]|uniref:ImmA/IrrE family metallo-endopeptidase n=1 Tax=Vagococcus hydrophili TaxID=2714947 RepID=A0A6G8AT70_9ENTE|nr:ImmA/IrrE family metallo-endopeptidase [Vagococcus hydrophili]QIL48196.1 ImmA/IrrE family metallo-endopeptidase [Vagococcus hydrophili]
MTKKDIHNNARNSAILFLNAIGSKDFIGPTLSTILDIKKIILIKDVIEDPEAEGFSAKKQGEKFLFVNTKFNQRLQNFTIAHELFHLDEMIVQLEDDQENERAADHFAANILLPENILFDKKRALENLGLKEIEVFFKLADLSEVPYETLFERYKELKISVIVLKRELELMKVKADNPFLGEKEEGFQQLRKTYMIDEVTLDKANCETAFVKLDMLTNYFENTGTGHGK